MGSGHNQVHALTKAAVEHGKAFGQAVRPIVHIGKNMGMKINHASHLMPKNIFKASPKGWPCDYFVKIAIGPSSTSLTETVPSLLSVDSRTTRAPSMYCLTTTSVTFWILKTTVQGLLLYR